MHESSDVYIVSGYTLDQYALGARLPHDRRRRARTVGLRQPSRPAAPVLWDDDDEGLRRRRAAPSVRAMRMWLSLLLVLPGLLRAEIRLTGVSEIDDKGPLFTLEDTSTGDRSGWLPIGGTFGSYSLFSYHAETGTLSLVQGERVLAVVLAAAVIQDAGPVQLPDQPAQSDGHAVEQPLESLSDEQLLARGLRRTQAGDTLARIARERETTVQQLRELNPEVDPRRLRVGQILRFRPE